MMGTLVRLDVADGVAVVTLDNPPVNAQPPALWAELAAVFDEISETAEIQAAILTGAGRMFSAGADIKEAPPDGERPGQVWGRLRGAREALNAIMECRKPVIAAINGPALGLGVSLIAVCDILLCSEAASIGLPEINVGLLGGARHAMRILPHSLVRRLFLTGGRADGRELYARGVVEACLPADELMPAAMAMAREIAAKSPVAVRMAKEALSTIEGMTIRDGYRFEQYRLVELSGTEDAQEAGQAFREKRAPRFKGR